MVPIEIKEMGHFDGDEIAIFTNKVFQEHYRGRSIVPRWTTEYFTWNIACSHGCDAFGAFHNGELVGFVMGLRQSYGYQGKRLEGVLASWLAVDTNRSSRLLSFRLIRRIFSSTFGRHDRRANDVMLFYTDPSSGNAALWKRMAPQINARMIRKVDVLAKIFNAEKVIGAEWHPPRGHQILALRHFCGIPEVAPRYGTVRPFEKKDIEACLALMTGTKSSAVFSRLWSGDELENHLQYGSVANSLLYHTHGRLQGIISYHLLDFIGRRAIRGAFVDFICLSRLRLREQREFIQVCLRHLKNLGCDMVLVPDSGIEKKLPLFLSGFVSARRSMNVMISTERPQGITFGRRGKIFVQLR